MLSFVVGTFLSVPSIGEPSIEGYAAGLLVAALGFAPLVGIGWGAALAERRWRHPGIRIAVIVAALLVISCARPFINDAISQALFDVETGDRWASRIITNIVTAFGLLTLCAVAVSYHRQLRATTARLRAAGSRMRAGIDHAERLRAGAPDLLRSTAAHLRADRDALLAGTVDYPAARGYADRVRAASHVLDTHARTEPAAVTEPVDIGSRAVPLLVRLGPTPPLAVCLTYVAATLPFGIAHGGPAVIVGAVIVAIAIDLAAWATVRATRNLPGVPRGLVFLAAWLAGGFGMLAVTFWQLPSVGTLGFVPLAGIPIVAGVISVSIDAYGRARAEERRTTALLRDTAVALAAAVDAARTPLERAIETLHGKLQGRCVILAARGDEGRADATVLDTFRCETDRILDALSGTAEETATENESVDDLLAAWSVALTLTVHIDDDTTEALSLPNTRPAAVQVLNEALVNAVKHSGARAATVRASLTGDTVHLHVASRGQLGALSRGALTTGAGAIGLGERDARTTLSQQGDDVVLEGRVPLPASTRNLAVAD